MLYVAMSSLQGRPMLAAFRELASLGVGIQLTPGNLPTPAFDREVASSGIRTKRHHGFSFDERKTTVWSDGACVVASDSVHPPQGDEPWEAWYADALDRPVIEVMYPGYQLGTGDAVERAMREGYTLAVDISHAFIQRSHGVMSEATWQRLCDYDRIAEVHVSANRGRYDTHQPITADTFGLEWARAKLRAGTTTVLECYMHRMPVDERRRQLEIIA
jgi:hypothetical protein